MNMLSRKTGHWAPEERQGRKRSVRKRVFSILEIQFKSLGDKGFLKFRKDVHKEN